MPVTRTKDQNKQMYALFSRLGIAQEEKEGLVLQYSSGRTSRSSELFTHEARELITDLSRGMQSAQLQRRKMIYYAHMMGWKTTEGKADMERLDEWCKTSGRFKKSLNSHSLSELPLLVSQFQLVYTSYVKNL